MLGEEIFQTVPKLARFSQGRQRKTPKKNVTMMQEFPWKSCFTIHLQSLSTNPKILKAFPKTFPVFWQNTQEWMAFTLSYFVWQQLKVHVSWWSDKKRQSQHLTKRLCQDRFKERNVSLYQRKVWSHDRNVRQCTVCCPVSGHFSLKLQ